MSKFQFKHKTRVSTFVSTVEIYTKFAVEYEYTSEYQVKSWENSTCIVGEGNKNLNTLEETGNLVHPILC